jgi:hypothetical protein
MNPKSIQIYTTGDNTTLAYYTFKESAHSLALATGQLVIAEECLFLSPRADPEKRALPIWSHQVSIVTDGSSQKVIDKTEKLIGEIGKSINAAKLGATYIDVSTMPAGWKRELDDQLPESCRGLFIEIALIRLDE